MRLALFVTLLMVSFSTLSASDSTLDFPALKGRVVDKAGILASSTVQQINVLAQAHEKATGNQVVVATLPDLQGYSIEEFGYQLGRHWGIGQSEKNNGVILIIATAERKVRIEVGYGLEGDLTDAISSNIINEVITPPFKLANFDEGVLNGTTAIIAALGGQYAMREPSGYNEKEIPDFWVIVMFIILLSIISSSRGGRGLLIGVLLGSMGGGRGGGSGRSSGGGFRGGGGSFGGGGASGGW